MPQPFKGVWTHDNNTLLQRPELAIKIAHITALWAHTEYVLGMLFSKILEADAVTGTAMYLSLISENARDSALQAAAKEKLSPEQFARFQALMKELKGPRKQRNTVAHGCWAISPEAPGSLILLDTKKMVRMYSFIGQDMRPMSKEIQKYAEAIKEHSEAQLEYTAKDFDNVINQILDGMKKVSEFYNELMKPFFEQLDANLKEMFKHSDSTTIVTPSDGTI